VGTGEPWKGVSSMETRSKKPEVNSEEDPPDEKLPDEELPE
jgi:hypothetical protein